MNNVLELFQKPVKKVCSFCKVDFTDSDVKVITSEEGNWKICQHCVKKAKQLIEEN